MMTGQDLIHRIQKNIGVPWQSQSDGFADGVLLGDPGTAVTGIATTYAPTLDVLKRAVASGKNVILCREGPFFSRGERAPISWRSGPMPSKELTDGDVVCQAKREFVSQNKMVIIRLYDNWVARDTNGQLRGLVRALDWEQYRTGVKGRVDEYPHTEAYFGVPRTSLAGLARGIKDKLKLRGARVVGSPESTVSKVALTYGLLLVADAERMLRQSGADVVVAGDAVEWEAAPYFQDLVAAGRAKGLILVGQEASEEPGSGEMAAWLKSFITEVPVAWIPAAEPFWTTTNAGGLQ